MLEWTHEHNAHKHPLNMQLAGCGCARNLELWREKNINCNNFLFRLYSFLHSIEFYIDTPRTQLVHNDKNDNLWSGYPVSAIRAHTNPQLLIDFLAVKFYFCCTNIDSSVLCGLSSLHRKLWEFNRISIGSSASQGVFLASVHGFFRERKAHTRTYTMVTTYKRRIKTHNTEPRRRRRRRRRL